MAPKVPMAARLALLLPLLLLPAAHAQDTPDYEGLLEFLGAVEGLEWEGYGFCDATAFPEIVCRQVHSKVEIVEITLIDRGLVGTLEGLYKLPFLEKLVLTGNDFTGSSINEAFCDLPYLTHLDLSNNSLEGDVPTRFGETPLAYLDLSNNMLTGGVPFPLQNIQTLDLSCNSLTGSIPGDLQLEFMERLSLANNSLTGVLPKSFSGTLFESFKHLDLGHNQLTGTLPPLLFSGSFLQILKVNNNRFSGPPPNSFSGEIKILHMQDNWLSGPLYLPDAPMEELFALGTNNICPMPDYSIMATASDYSEPFAESCTPCGEHTCLNGTCTQVESGFSCDCPPGEFGTYCEISCPPDFFGNGFECVACPANATSPALSWDLANCTCPIDQQLNMTSVKCEAKTCPKNVYRGVVWEETAVGTVRKSPCAHGFYVFPTSFPNSTLQPSRACRLSPGDNVPYWDEPDMECEASCLAQGCSNQGVCLQVTSGHVCFCDEGKGRFCNETGAARCADLFCQHGTCVASEDLTKDDSCNCTGTGFRGTFCQEDVDDCASMPCRNGGTCFDVGANRFVCECLPGFSGSICQTDVNDCFPGSCLNGGECFDAGPNAYSCNCTGTGHTGTRCTEPLPEDCRPSLQGCLNGGICRVAAGSDTAQCDCGGTGHEGAFCQAALEGDCRSPLQACLHGGVCRVRAQEDQAGCDCKGTGYQGPFCQDEVEGDCRTSRFACANGRCVFSEEVEDLKVCACHDGFAGLTCSQELYRSLASNNIVFYVLIPLVLVFLLLAGFLLWANRHQLSGNLRGWLVLSGHLFLSCMGIFDLFTDAFFVIACYDLGINEPSKAWFFYTSLAFLCASWLANLTLTVLVSARWVGMNRGWGKLHPGEAPPHTRLPVGFFFGFTLLSNDGVGMFHLASRYLFLERGYAIRAKAFSPYLLGFFFAKALLEDLPQLVIQGMFQTQAGSASALVVFSMISSALSLFLAVVAFFFSETFDAFKRRFTEGAQFQTVHDGAAIAGESHLELVRHPAQQPQPQPPREQGEEWATLHQVLQVLRSKQLSPEERRLLEQFEEELASPRSRSKH